LESTRASVKIYFIESENGFIKIGISRDVEKRFKSLQGACPVKLSLLKFFIGNRELEQLIHEKFRHLRIRGEWFRKDPELDHFIKNLEIMADCAKFATKKPKSKLHSEAIRTEDELVIFSELRRQRNEALSQSKTKIRFSDYTKIIQYYLFLFLRKTGLELRSALMIESSSLRFVDGNWTIAVKKQGIQRLFRIDDSVKDLIEEWNSVKKIWTPTFSKFLFHRKNGSSYSSRRVEQISQKLFSILEMKTYSPISFSNAYKKEIKAKMLADLNGVVDSPL